MLTFQIRQTEVPNVGLPFLWRHNLMPRGGVIVFLMDENSLPNCSLNHSPISCPLMASASLGLSFGAFITWKSALSVMNLRLCSSE